MTPERVMAWLEVAGVAIALVLASAAGVAIVALLIRLFIKAFKD